MNAHTIAWQMLHCELRRRLGGESRSDLGEVERFAQLYQQARDDGISDLDIMAELAGFAAIATSCLRWPIESSPALWPSVVHIELEA